MTSITSSAMFQQRISPRDMLQNELLSEVSSGTSHCDYQAARRTALAAIDAPLLR